jgi:hypothetical protein
METRLTNAEPLTLSWHSSLLPSRPTCSHFPGLWLVRLSWLLSLSVSLTGLSLSSVVSAAQSLTARLLLTFTSIACLRRPVNEQTRLLTATEISALDMMTTSLSAINAVSCRTFPSLDDALTELR